MQRKHRLVVLCEKRSGTDQMLAFISRISPYCDGIVIVDSAETDHVTPCPSTESKVMLYIRSSSAEQNQTILQRSLSDNGITAEWALYLYSDEMPIFPPWEFPSNRHLSEFSVLGVTFVLTQDGHSYYVSDNTEAGFIHEIRLFRVPDMAQAGVQIHCVREGDMPLSGLVFSRTVAAPEWDTHSIGLFTPIRPLNGIYRSGNRFLNYADLPEASLTSAIRQSIDRIAGHYLTDGPATPNFGLYTGTAGLVLFFAQLYLHTRRKVYFRKMNEYLDRILEHIAGQQELCPTFCDGLAGFGWLVCYLADKDLIEADQGYFDLFDNALRFHMRNLAGYNMHDAMHGMLSIARYFLRRNAADDVHYALEQVACRIEQGPDGELLWPVQNRHKAANYDFGLAHGTAGVLYFLDQCHSKNIEPDLSRRLGDGLVRFYFRNEQPTGQDGSYYPYSVYCNDYRSDKRKPVTSRLAWCYGDLSALSVIYRHALLTRNSEWQQSVIDKLVFTTRRRNLEQVNIHDAQFCHGAAGLAHMYCRLYHLAGHTEFRDAAVHWIKVTLQMQTPDSATGYLFVRSPDDPVHIPSESLLEGSVGVGLALLSALGHNYMDWDEAMMLS